MINQSIHFCGFLPDFCSSVEIGVHLVKNYRIKQLNAQYRQKNKATNVLSFPYVKFAQGKFLENEMQMNNFFLGEMFVAFDFLILEAIQQNLIWQNHLQHLVVHGLLHMFGFDHENDDEYSIMNEWEQKILNKLTKN